MTVTIIKNKQQFQKTTMVLNINAAAIAAAAAALKMKNQQQESSAKDTENTKKTAKAKRPTTKRMSKAQASTAKPELHVECMADPNMVSAITNYLYTRPDILPKLANPKKSIEGCCQYIIGKMKKIAEKQRNGANAVGLFQDDKTIYGMAMHYYDENDEDLAKEDEK